VTGLTHVSEPALAERLCDVVPCADRAFFLKSGAEATAAAVRLARAATGRDRVVGAGYFGWLDWWSTGPGVPAGASADYTPVPWGDAAALEAAVDAAGGALAAVVLEPVVEREPPPGYLARARALATRAGAVLVFDEVKLGCRLHPGGYQAVCGVTPDLAVFGKALANGYPLAAVVGGAAGDGRGAPRVDLVDARQRGHRARRRARGARPARARRRVRALARTGARLRARSRARSPPRASPACTSRARRRCSSSGSPTARSPRRRARRVPHRRARGRACCSSAARTTTPRSRTTTDAVDAVRERAAPASRPCGARRGGTRDRRRRARARPPGAAADAAARRRARRARGRRPRRSAARSRCRRARALLPPATPRADWAA
jgi:hypothetical protein